MNIQPDVRHGTVCRNSHESHTSNRHNLRYYTTFFLSENMPLNGERKPSETLAEYGAAASE